MYVALREWMRTGGAIPDDDELAEQLISIEFHFNKKTEIMLMAKEDMRLLGRPSPDWADALAMTFAYPVAARRWKGRSQNKSEYDPLSQAAFREGYEETVH
jgi:phage terminase large subunit